MAAERITDSKLLRALLEAGAALNSSLDLDTLLELTMDSACRIFGAGAASLLLLDEESGTLRFRTATGEKREELKSYRLKLGEGIAGWVAQTGKPLIVADPQSDDRFLEELGEKIDYLTTSLICVPLRIQDRVIGVLEVLNHLTGRFSNEDLEHLELLAEQVSRAIQNARLYSGERDEKHRLEQILEDRYQPIGNSQSFRGALEVALKAAPSKATVLLRGESGTGKEVIARTIHRASQRSGNPMISVNCAAISEGLLESELFGYERGAFTGAERLKKGKFELASGGTIFLDEIGNMSPSIQSKILRVLQEKEVDRVGGERPVPVDVRVVAATNSNLEKMIADGRFREDLFYRLNVIQIVLPPLRERREDIPLLIERFIHRYNAETKKNIRGISQEALEVLLKYRFPGNVRELQNVIERAVVLEEEELIRPERLPFFPSASLGSGVGVSREASLSGGFPSLAEVERRHVEAALRRTRGVKTEACKLLGVSRPTLDRKIQKYRIQID
jgi:Nif-specific regulatory protein